MKRKGLASRKGMIATCALLMALQPTWTLAQDQKKENWQPNKREQEVLSSQAFLANHPDMMNRMRAMEEIERGDEVRAASYFRRAAHYADKQSQATYAEMLWEGRGVPQDRAAAYAWMDLAAERGYSLFLAFRERYWDELGEADRARAIEVGQEVYAQYGDDVAKPRLENIIRRASRNITGSRTGSVGFLKIVIPGPGGGITIDGKDFYDKRFWEPKRYWRWQAEVLEGVTEGRVIVGDLKTLPKDAPPEKEKKD